MSEQGMHFTPKLQSGRMPEHLVHALACEAYMLSPIARRVVDDRARVVNAEPDNLS